jgi:predicted amidohydrolase YtcJ
MKQISLVIFTFLLIGSSFAQKKKADLILFNAKIYTVDAKFSTASALVIKDGKIEATGESKTLFTQYDAKEKIDAAGRFIYPGFNDAHAHFLGFGLGLQTADLVDTESWEEILAKLTAFSKQKNVSASSWIVGRGWDQNDWAIKEFPTKEKLDALFPNNPVLLTRVDGHAAVANQKALDLAGVTINTKQIGGQVEVKEGKLTGVLVDNAVDLVSAIIPSPSTDQLISALKEAQEACLATGLTSVADCGVDYRTVELMQLLQNKGELKMRVYAMLSDEPKNFNWAKQNGRIKTSSLNVSSFKVYADGALGSRGACLLHP